MKKIQVPCGIIIQNKKFLVSKRLKGKHLAGFFEFIGGKKEFGESLESALIREIYEEVNIKVENFFIFFEEKHFYKEKDLEVSLYFFIVDKFIGEIKANENQFLKWVCLDELQKLKFPEANKNLLKKVAIYFGEKNYK